VVKIPTINPMGKSVPLGIPFRVNNPVSQIVILLIGQSLNIVRSSLEHLNK